MVAPIEQEDHPGRGAHAAHPDHLAGDVDELIVVQQLAPIGLQRALVAPQQGLEVLGDLRRLHAGQYLL